MANMNNKNKDSWSKIVYLQNEERLGAAGRNGAFLAVEDLSPSVEPTLTIARVGRGECVLDAGRREDHDVIFFAEQAVPGCPVVRPLICNSTNRKTLLQLYGDLSAQCLEGKRVRLYIDPHVRSVGGGYTSGIRIRKLIPEPAPAPMPPQQPTGPICADCGNPIQPAGNYTAEAVADYGMQRWGRPLCAACQHRLSQQPNM